MTPAAPGRRILIGVHVDSPAQDVAATLSAVFEATPAPFELRLLPDASDEQEAEALARALDAFEGIAQRRGPPGRGAAACFNALIAEAADVYVFLEGGARPMPGWLDALLAALDADPAHGLAGPSTNRGWNEQAIAARCGTALPALWAQADELAARHAGQRAYLEPLHSLSDFCYAVRNEVVAAVGAADEAYGQGPCWEMDYNVRAARAGFRGVWAKDAFVHRAPPSAPRLARESAGLERSKQAYQDRFCGWRATQPLPGDYHAHCSGDACRYFAMHEHMRIYLAAPLRPSAQDGAGAVEAVPLVSCIMPTRGRPEFVAQAIRYFQRQDWPERELVIVYEDDRDLAGAIDDPRVRCVRVAPRTTIGAKRNEAVRAARGDIVAHWDDDDWYGDARLSRQVAPLLANVADITGLNDMLFLAVQHGEFWRASRALFRRLFVENVSGGTLVYRRDVWRRGGPYPATSLREDADFLVKAMRAGARLCRLPGRDLCVYVRHQGNTWKFREGRYLQESEWSQVQPPAGLAEDLAFYFPDAGAAPRTPLVSCIMPTADRRPFVAQAIRQYLQQDHPHRELVIVDDGQDGIADLVPMRDDIRYVRLDRRSTVGAKRNIACELARGEIVAHWDDDDWRAPGWLRSQVAALTAAGADVCGLDKVFFYRPQGREAWQYVWDGRAHWVCGGTLCYRRDFWRAHPFPDVNTGEDNAFVWNAPPERVAVNPDQHLYVACVHAGNTSPKATGTRRWRTWPVEEIEQLVLACHAG